MSKESENNAAQKAGSQADLLSEVVERFNPFTSVEYKNSFFNGVANQPKSSGDRDSSDTSDSGDSGSSSEGSSSGCYLTTACATAMGMRLPDDCPELLTLRRFRDEYVAKLPNGMAEIRAYYDLAPRIVRAIDRRSDKAEFYSKIYNLIVTPCARLVSQGAFAEAFALYKLQTENLAAAVLS